MKRTGNMKWLYIFIIAIVAVLFLLTAFSQKLTIKEYYEKTDKVTGNIKLMLFCDLHDTYYGEEQEELIKIIEEEQPDALLFAGDILDDERSNEASLFLLKSIGEKYPSYYVSGNHEWWSGKMDEMKEQIRECNVSVLEGTSDVLRVKNQYIRICGIDDPEVGIDEWNSQLVACEKNLGDNLYTVLMTHRPEQILRYHGYDLIVSGHTHGGVLRIPSVLNGLYAPNQGWFPKYCGGRYEFEDRVMIVSRGLSKSLVPRIFTPPEVVIINIEQEI